MPYNDLGYFIYRNLRAWSKSAIECYKNNLMCNLCSLPEDLKPKCKMKATVIELYKKFGKPQKIKDIDDANNKC